MGTEVVRLVGGPESKVVFPEARTCCGQMHVNSGYCDEAHAPARRLVDVFHRFDAIVSPSS